MADETPQRPGEESKKDTVRINLPPGLTGRGATPSITPPTPTPSLRPAATPGSPEEEAKKETAVMGRPVEAPKPKKDTARVQVTAAKPAGAPEAPRPTVKLQQDPLAPAPVTRTVVATSAPVVVTGGGNGAMDLVAMILSLCIAGYLAYLAFF